MPDGPHESLKDFPVIFSTPVHWGDQDSFGHVNNTVYFRWFESARIAYFDRIGLSELMVRQKVGPILAAISCNYRRALTFPDTVQVGARITRLGRSSLTMVHALFSEKENMMAADGESTIVVLDYQAGRPCAIPPEIRDAVQRIEGKEL